MVVGIRMITLVRATSPVEYYAPDDATRKDSDSSFKGLSALSLGQLIGQGRAVTHT